MTLYSLYDYDRLRFVIQRGINVYSRFVAMLRPAVHYSGVPIVLFFGVPLSIIIGGCTHVPIRLTADQIKIRDALKEIDPENDPLPRATPVIDIHTHTFNARYLPLQGILRGKRDAYPPFSWLIGDLTADAIAQAIVNHTELSPMSREPGIPRTLGPTPANDLPGFLARRIDKILVRAEDKQIWKDDEPPLDQIAKVDKFAKEDMDPIDKMAVRTVAKMMGMGDHLDQGKTNQKKISGTQAIVRFLWLITQADGKMPQIYRDMHKRARVKGPIKMVSLMMDLPLVYNQNPSANLLDFSKQQIARMEYFKNQRDSDMIYFVAYNPYYDFQPGGKPGDALKIVQDAIEHHGAAGVKVYPPSGYRPYHNDVPGRPVALFTDDPGKQWDTRYGNMGPERSAVLDAQLEQLLLWCRDNDKPVLTHSGYGEFEARKGYGEHHSHPKFWGEFLKAHPEKDGSPCKLRLCLGHAGGGDYWLASEKHSDWGKEAYRMCTTYPNVYCEITTGDEFVDDDYLAFLVDRLSRCFRESEHYEVDRDNVGRPSGYSFAKKLLYGTDWFLPDTAEPNEALMAAQKAFIYLQRENNQSDLYAQYFHLNAEAFLNQVWE